MTLTKYYFQLPHWSDPKDGRSCSCNCNGKGWPGSCGQVHTMSSWLPLPLTSSLFVSYTWSSSCPVASFCHTIFISYKILNLFVQSNFNYFLVTDSSKVVESKWLGPCVQPLLSRWTLPCTGQFVIFWYVHFLLFVTGWICPRSPCKCHRVLCGDVGSGEDHQRKRPSCGRCN